MVYDDLFWSTLIDLITKWTLQMKKRGLACPGPAAKRPCLGNATKPAGPPRSIFSFLENWRSQHPPVLLTAHIITRPTVHTKRYEEFDLF